MNDNPPHGKKESNGCQQERPVDQFPQPTISSPRLSSSTASSQDSQERYLGAHVHPPAPDMDSAGDARRRRAMLMKHPNGSIVDTLRDMNTSRRQRRKRGNDMDNANTQRDMANLLDDGHSSEYSSVSTSDDVELDHLSSEQGSTDDEETGLTKKDLGKRKRKRRKHTQLGVRVAGTASVTKQERSSADKNVMKALIMNALLIASWYAFSLSISIVSPAWLPAEGVHGLIEIPVQQMDVFTEIPGFPFPPFHYVHAHGRAIYPGFSCPLLHTAPSSTSRQHHKPT